MHIALIVSAIAGRMAKRLEGTGFEHHQAQLESRVEQWAVGCMAEEGDQEPPEGQRMMDMLTVGMHT